MQNCKSKRISVSDVDMTEDDTITGLHLKCAECGEITTVHFSQQ